MLLIEEEANVANPIVLQQRIAQQALDDFIAQCRDHYLEHSRSPALKEQLEWCLSVRNGSRLEEGFYVAAIHYVEKSSTPGGRLYPLESHSLQHSPRLLRSRVVPDMHDLDIRNCWSTLACHILPTPPSLLVAFTEMRYPRYEYTGAHSMKILKAVLRNVLMGGRVLTHLKKQLDAHNIDRPVTAHGFPSLIAFEREMHGQLHAWAFTTEAQRLAAAMLIPSPSEHADALSVASRVFMRQLQVALLPFCAFLPLPLCQSFVPIFFLGQVVERKWLDEACAFVGGVEAYMCDGFMTRTTPDVPALNAHLASLGCPLTFVEKPLS